jgi:glycosyltransferase involved in cell wall biosynthesis
MHLAFVDIVYGYTADRPDSDQPLGGTTSAVCFLARELVKAGVQCTFFNKIEQPDEALGIRSLPLEALIDERANPAYDAFIFCGRWVDWLVNLIREQNQKPFIGWMHESQFYPGLVPASPALNGIVYVSEWQKKVNTAHRQGNWKETVIRNAINPQIAGMYAPAEKILGAKSKPPVLLYAGSTPRGAFHLPPLLDVLRPLRADFSMEIYCDCTPSKDPKSNEAYITWMKSLPNVSHVGMVGQTKLAARMKSAALLVSPNPWPETSCITLMEALAAGLLVVTTNRAALPETGEGFPQHIKIEDPDAPLRFDMPMPYSEFATAIDRTLTRWLEGSDQLETALRRQVDYFKTHYQWQQRVRPWLDYLRSF